MMTSIKGLEIILEYFPSATELVRSAQFFIRLLQLFRVSIYRQATVNSLYYLDHSFFCIGLP